MSRQRKQPPAGKPRAGRPGKAPSRRRRWARRFAVLTGAGFLLMLAGFAVAYATIEIPDPNEGFETQTTYVYYADGKTELGRYATQNRTSIPLADVPEHVQDAVIAAEDRSFWTNRGIDPRGVVRAAYNNLRGDSTQGASTITQQYVKVLYLTQDRTYTRKLKEAVLSLKVQRQMSKQEVLQGYLNTIYFGRGAYGIEAAAQSYFGVSAEDLNVRQGAALAAMIKAPNSYDPADGKDERQALADRYGYVIEGMDETGTLPARLEGTQKAFRLPKFPRVEGSDQLGGQKGHVLTMVGDALRDQGFSDEEIYGGGLRVTTTFTRKAMRAAEAAVAEQRPDLDQLHVGVASVEPGTGALRGMYAGQDFLDSELNWAVAGGAPGSTMKPAAVAAALKEGYSLDSTFDGNSPLEIGGVEFNNQGEGLGRSYGSNLSLLDATRDSVNTAFVDLTDTMPDGANKVLDTAVDLGVPRDAPGLEPGLGIALGSATVSPIDMANAYATIAAGGLANEVYVLEAVRSGSTEALLYQHAPEEERVLSEEIASDVSYALQQVAENGTGRNADTIGRPVAVKTGTATTDGGNVRSSWMVGYTPQLSTAVMYVRGTGNDPLNGYMPTFYGGEYPARTWAATMSRALADEPVVAFPPPARVQQTAEGNQPAPEPAPAPAPSSPEPSDRPEPTNQPDPTDEPDPTEEPTPGGGPSTPPKDEDEGPNRGEGKPPAPGGPTEGPTGNGGANAGGEAGAGGD